MSCTRSGIAAPKVATLVVDPSDSKGTALVVFPTCEEIVVQVKRVEGGTVSRITAENKSIEAVESYPSVDSLFLGNNEITSFKATSGSKLKDLDLTNNQLTSLNGINLPLGLQTLTLDFNNIQSFTALAFPSTLTELFFRKADLTSLSKYEFPDSLDQLTLNGNKGLQSLNGFVIPPSLSYLECNECGITEIVGVVFPTSFQSLVLSGPEITSFDVRASDLAQLGKMKLQIGKIQISSCSDARGTLTTVATGVSACVYDDTTFEIKYPPPQRTTPTPTTGSGSGTAGPASSTPTTTDPISTEPPQSTTGGEGSGGGGGGSNTTQMVLVGALVLLAVVVGVGIGFLFQRRRRRRTASDRDAPYNNGDAQDGVRKHAQSDSRTRIDQTISGPGRSHKSSASLHNSGSYHSGFLENDVRNDPLLIPHRLPHEELHIVTEIAKGGFGVVYLATLYSQEVVIKQVSPLKSDSGKILRRFMDEIRLFATLQHPKIVRFIGLTWTNLLDLSLVMEYMPSGDLHSFVRANNKLPAHCQPLKWFSQPAEPRCKALLALDIAEALVYLHSFASPIVHRDLKAKNVLLSENYIAKLGDFGVSRETCEDETMTGGVGTTAWIAPEVLQGERYSEKADIYSFGILLCELDLGGHPYNLSKDGGNNNYEDGEENDGAALTDAKIAYLVSTKALKPTLRDDCPRAVEKLILQCIEFDEKDRPNAVELHYNLRKVREASLEWGFI